MAKLCPHDAEGLSVLKNTDWNVLGLPKHVAVISFRDNPLMLEVY